MTNLTLMLAIAFAAALAVASPRHPISQNEIDIEKRRVLELLKLGATDSALKVMTELTLRAPGDAYGQIFLGAMYRKAGQSARAESLFRECTRRFPANWNAQYQYALELSRDLHDPVSALAAFDRAIRLNPDARDAYVGATYLLVSQHRDSQAEGYAARWLLRHPKDGVVSAAFRHAIQSRNLGVPATIGN